ncbi:SubName: Full=Uncharacterized protein {ECO:0000313/EMBL:CCA70900.1} [Serendipita indica DSM 11827]|uniref:CCHC-type domain-containing protein n=1 Tax=Serendipita indica (strain DSM 11827) TaxID=1109443 RepID=G4THX4_SERID|nr:SubName: Full=Uncharacterized protein {ECO:0000313/EMBL:CCA70900.1} [Serendipita indica DSM 11827]CCA70900.1 hypothetical protein PIIN_04836 [Serendipita indica DSM 11827]
MNLRIATSKLPEIGFAITAEKWCGHISAACPNPRKSTVPGRPPGPYRPDSTGNGDRHSVNRRPAMREFGESNRRTPVDDNGPTGNVRTRWAGRPTNSREFGQNVKRAKWEDELSEVQGGDDKKMRIEYRGVQNITCLYCGEPGHLIRDCLAKPTETCRNCGSEGHQSRECPEPWNPSRRK